MPTVQSVHIPAAMGDISIRSTGTKKWKHFSINDIYEYAKKYRLTFVQAYSRLLNDIVNKED